MAYANDVSCRILVAEDEDREGRKKRDSRFTISRHQPARAHCRVFHAFTLTSRHKHRVDVDVLRKIRIIAPVAVNAR